MKVVYIHHASGYGGSSRSLGIVIKRLILIGVDAHIICPEGRAADYFLEITDNVYTFKQSTFPLLMTIASVKNSKFQFFRNYVKGSNSNGLVQLVERINPDIVHLNELGLSTIMTKLKKLGYPVVVHARTMPRKTEKLINWYALRKIRKYCDHLICITGSVEKAMQGVIKKSIIYNPIEFIPEAKIYNISNKTLNFVSLSAIQINKGVFEILKAAKHFKNDTRIRFTIAGGINRKPSQISIKHRILSLLGLIDFDTGEKFLNYIKDNSIDNVDLLGHIKDIHKLLIDSDVMLAPMHLNAPPRSVYEAGIYGVPSILSMEDKVYDVVEPGINGFVIDEKNENQLIEAISKIIADPFLIEKMGHQARIRFVKNHDVDLCSKQILEIYRKFL